MKNVTLGLTVPLLLLFAAASTALVPPAAAQGTTYEISGRVVSDAQVPIAGAQVNGYTYQEDMSRSSTGSSDSAITDDAGKFTLRLAEGKGSVSVYYEKWRRSDYREIVITGNVSDIEFTLVTPPAKTAIITGYVIGPDGRPIEGAEVQLNYGCCYAMPATTEPAVAEGEGGSAEPNASPEMTTRPAIWPGYYYDDYQVTKTDADGKFRFETYGGPRQIVAWAKGYAQTTENIEAKENATTEVTLRLEKVPDRSAIFTGRVVNADTGAPISDAVVSVRSLEWGRYAEARTGKDGTFRLETVPGWSEVSVNFWPNYGDPVPLAAETDSAGADADAPVSSDAMIIRPVLESQYYPLAILIDLEDGDQERDLKLEAKPKASVALVGYVVDPDAKKGVEGARVSVWNHETGDWGEAITDATGSFRILVRPGHYSGNAWKEGYLSGTQSFLVEAGATQRVDILLPAGTTKYAPCYDETDCGPVIMYADGAKAGGSGDAVATGIASSPPPSAPGAAPQSRESAALDESDSGSAASGPDTSRAATFAGTGGGLPPYDPSDASAPAAEGAPSEVPAIGLLALLGAIAIGALAMRRTKG